MVNVVIIEDEKIASDYLERLIKEFDPAIQIIKKLDSVEASVKWLAINSADLLFLDVHLADDTSFAIFEQLHLNIPVIFTTAYDQYAIKAFKLNSIDYLLKPIDKAELHAALRKFQSQRSNIAIDFTDIIAQVSRRQNNFQHRFLVSTGQKLKSIQSENVAYFFSEQKLTFLIDVEGKQYIVDSSLDKLEPLLDPEKFFRINRQFIISYPSIKSMVNYSKSRVKIELIPSSTKETIVSVERSSDFKNWLNR
ncbi:MAG: LytR/AlgR family response regulator transcription factor [Chitinophagales bacterium]